MKTKFKITKNIGFINPFYVCTLLYITSHTKIRPTLENFFFIIYIFHIGCRGFLICQDVTTVKIHPANEESGVSLVINFSSKFSFCLFSLNYMKQHVQCNNNEYGMRNLKLSSTMCCYVIVEHK